MPALALRLVSELRSRWRAWLALALLIGVAGGIVIATVAGARRTDSSYDRFLESAHADDVLVAALGFPLDLDAVRRLPEVAEATGLAHAFLTNARPGEHFILSTSPFFATEDDLFRTINRPKVLEGRRPHPDRADEIAISPAAASLRGLKVGTTISMQALAPPQVRALLSGQEVVAAGPSIDLRVVGMEVAPGDLQPNGGIEAPLRLSPAFGRVYGDQVATTFGLAVRLKRGAADVTSFKAGVERISGGRPPLFITQEDDAAQVQRSIHLQAVVLRLFAVLAGVAFVFILGQALARQTFLQALDHPTLRALGMTRNQLWVAALGPSILIAVVATAVAAVIAILASGLMPFGLARQVEPSPGMALDSLVVPTGLAAVMAVTLVLAAVAAWRVTRRQPGGGPGLSGVPRASRLAERLARAGAPSSVVVGVRMAVEPGRGSTAVPTRSTLLGTVFSVISLVTAFTFGASFQHLLTTPRLYGVNWDTVVGNGYGPDLAESIVPALAAIPVVAEFSTVAAASAAVGGVRTQALGLEAVRGSVFPPIVSGREPERPDEVVLGGKTLRDVDRKVGDTVRVTVGDSSAEVRIVGRGVFPDIGASDPSGLGEGALFTAQGLRRLVPDAPHNLFLIRYGEGIEVRDGRVDLQKVLGRQLLLDDISEPPRQVADFGQVDNMPVVLAGLLAVMAGATLAHTLGAVVRRRRRDLAILKTLGFVRQQVWSAVAWQATTITVVGLLFGAPLGISAGRWAWRVFAEGLGIVPEPVLAVSAVVLTIPIALIVANLIAAVPGRVAARTQPARVLRAE